MTYSSGQLIEDGDYNTFVTGSASGTENVGVPNVNTLWGAGDTTTKGYGQPDTLPATSTGAMISATQWANLFNRMWALSLHQGSTIVPVTMPVTGQEIRSFTAVQSNLNVLWNNRSNAAAVGSSYAPAGASVSRTTSWSSQVTTTQTIDFGSAAALQAFFNAGGQIRHSMTRTGGAANVQNNFWTNACATIGQMIYTGAGSAKVLAGTSYTGFQRIGGGGTPSTYNTSTGVHNLTSTLQDMIVYSHDGYGYLYDNNDIRVRAKKNTAGLVTIETRFRELTGATVTGTLSSNLSIIYPSTTVLADVWGVPVFNSSQTGS